MIRNCLDPDESHLFHHISDNTKLCQVNNGLYIFNQLFQIDSDKYRFL